MSADPIRIILVDDHHVILTSWKTLLETSPCLKVIAECDNGEIAIREAERLIPDIMLVDIKMTPLNGFEITERLLQKIPSIKIIGISVNNQPHYASKMLEFGARGFLTKTSTLEEIHHAIREVQQGNYYICEEICKKLSSSG